MIITGATDRFTEINGQELTMTSRSLDTFSDGRCAAPLGMWRRRPRHAVVGRLRLAVLRRWIPLLVCLFPIPLVGQQAPVQPTTRAVRPDTVARARVVAVAADRSFITLRSPVTPSRRGVWAVPQNEELREQVRAIAAGDLVTAYGLREGTGVTLSRIDPVLVTVTPTTRLLTILGAAALLFVLAAVAAPGGARWFVLGEDNRYSNSKTQLALWFWVLLTSYLATLALRVRFGGPAFTGGVEVPTNLLWLSGISALTFAGAKQIVRSHLDDPSRTGERKKTPPLGGPSFPRDLVTDDSGRRPDIGDFQMVLVALVAALVYGVHVFGWLGEVTLKASVTLPDVDSTLLGIFGIGQGAYLAKKYVGDTGASAAPGAGMNVAPPRPPMR